MDAFSFNYIILLTYCQPQPCLPLPAWVTVPIFLLLFSCSHFSSSSFTPQVSCRSVSVNRLKPGFQRQNINESGVRVESKRPVPSPEGPDNLRSSLYFPPVGEIPGGRGTGLPVPMSGGTGIGVGADRGVPGVGVIGTGVCVAVGAVPGVDVIVPGGVISAGVWAEGCC